MLPEGTFDLPPDTIASVVTYLQITSRPALRPPLPEDGRTLVRLRGADVDRYLAVYRRLGERWMWFARLRIGTDSLRAILEDQAVHAFEVRIDGAPAGLLELDFRSPEGAELAYFGLFDEFVGAGHGRWLMDRALEIAFARPIERLFVHTCNLDHPGAVEFYRRSGFEPYKLAVEIAKDPRITGELPRHAARHVPLFRT
jgi:GNAT superfamily N-acetyltransferase